LDLTTIGQAIARMRLDWLRLITKSQAVRGVFVQVFGSGLSDGVAYRLR